MKIKTFANAYTVFERVFPSGMYLVKLYIGDNLSDKILTDEYKSAREYLRAFNAIAKSA